MRREKDDLMEVQPRESIRQVDELYAVSMHGVRRGRWAEITGIDTKWNGRGR